MRRRRSALRVFFKTTGSVYAAAAAGCAGSTDLGPDPGTVSLPAPVAGLITMKLAEFPQLAAEGGLVGRAPGVADPLAIIRDNGNHYLAVVATCTHMACPLRFNPLNATLDCSCHGSTFELDGRVITGPADKALRTLPLQFDGQLIGIKTS